MHYLLREREKKRRENISCVISVVFIIESFLKRKSDNATTGPTVTIYKERNSNLSSH